MQSVSALLVGLNSKKLCFNDVIAYINKNYAYTPSAFYNGELCNQAGQNEGSCRLFSFAQLNGLNVDTTLKLFAEHYQSVIDTPQAYDHQNIRQFMKYGWSGISFKNQALTPKESDSI